MVLWRAWYLRDDMVHAKGAESIPPSALFLYSYLKSLYTSQKT